MIVQLLSGSKALAVMILLIVDSHVVKSITHCSLFWDAKYVIAQLPVCKDDLQIILKAKCPDEDRISIHGEIIED